MTATHEILIDWDGDETFDHAGSDVTARVLGTRTPVTSRYGRDLARALAPGAVGTARLEVNNASRDYSPENGSSPLAGLVLPGRGLLWRASLAYVTDDFGRTVASGWGTSTSGEAWTVAGGSAANYAVSAGVGTHTLTSVNVSRRSSVPAPSSSRVRFAATVSVDQVATGAPIRTAVIPMAADMSTDHVRAQVNWETGGTLSLSLVERISASDDTLTTVALDGTYSAGTQVRVVGEIDDGTILRGKAWLLSGDEPDDWQLTDEVTATAAVSVGVRSIAASGNTNASPIVSYDDVRVSLDATPYRGYLDDYDVQPGIDQRSVRISCQDPLGRLRGVRVSTDLYGGLRTGEAIDRLLDAVGWPEDARDLDTGATTIPWWWLSDDDAYQALQQIVDSEGPGALCVADGDGNIVFRDRHHRLVRAASTTAQATWRGSGTADPVMSEPLVYDHGWRDIINSVEIQVPVRALSGALSVVWSQDAQVTLSDGETVQLIAVATSPFASAVTPVSGTDITVLSGVVTATLSRTSGQVTTVSLTASGGPAVVTAVQVRAYALATATTVQITAEDSTSISRYGRRSLPSGRQPVWAGVHDARAIADITLAQRAERLPIVTVTMHGSSDTQLTEQLNRDLSDRVRIVEPETGLDADFFVEQTSHELRGGPHLITRFGCEMVPTPADTPFTFDLAGAGFDDGTFGAQGLDDPDTVFIFDDPVQGQFDVGAFGN